MQNLKKFISKFEGGRRSFFGFGTGPEADWRVILVSTTIVLVCVGVVNVTMFLSIDKGDVFIIDNTSSSENTFDINKLRETSQYYQDRASRFDQILRQDKSTLIDPSL